MSSIIDNVRHYLRHPRVQAAMTALNGNGGFQSDEQRRIAERREAERQAELDQLRKEQEYEAACKEAKRELIESLRPELERRVLMAAEFGKLCDAGMCELFGWMDSVTLEAGFNPFTSGQLPNAKDPGFVYEPGEVTRADLFVREVKRIGLLSKDWKPSLTMDQVTNLLGKK